ncbi:MAG TPA: cyclic nucleotide-binding domain-containing protein [Marmoricola sp.]|jgi:CRP-like cAMP-binding protein|nr:cyclic nucleotide-binding domain-containing protein [Marmoricola sp.]
MVNRSMTSGDRPPRGEVRAELRLLGAVPTLTHAPAALLSAMVDVGRVVQAAPDWPLLLELTAPEKAYVLLDGHVEVRRGEILGELGIVRRRLRSATVVTATRTTLLYLARADVEKLRAEQPYFRDLVGEAMIRKTA